MWVCFLQFASLCRQTNCQWRKPLWVRVPQFPVCLTIFIFFSLCFVCLLSCSGYSTPFSWDVSMSKGLLCIVTFCRGGGVKKKKENPPPPGNKLFLHCTSFSFTIPKTGRRDHLILPQLHEIKTTHSRRACTLAPIILDGWVGWWETAKKGGEGVCVGGTHLVAFHSPAQLSWPAPEKPAPVLRCVSDACANKTWLRLKLPVPSKNLHFFFCCTDFGGSRRGDPPFFSL